MRNLSVVFLLAVINLTGCPDAVASGRDSGTDAGACTPDADYFPGQGNCDGVGRAWCQMYAQMNYPGGTAYGACASNTCVRANLCDGPAPSLWDAASCRCGVGPACLPGEVCAGATPTEVPRCRCVSR